MKPYVLFLFGFLFALTCKSQITVSGFVYDSETHESIIGANIIDSLNSNGTITNTQAYYVLKTSSSKLKISFVGYQTQTVSLTQSKDTIINVYLKPLAYKLSEVIINAKGNNSINDQA
jgi:hypothetical protein